MSRISSWIIGLVMIVLFGVSLIAKAEEPFYIPLTVSDPNPDEVYAFAFASEYPTDVIFDASDSEGYNGTSIVSYDWDFGNDAIGTGDIVTNSYTEKGTNSVLLTVTDDGGVSRYACVMVYILKDAVFQSPTCAITAPANGATYTAPASVTINASASDADGNVTKVEFYSGTTKLGEDTTSPYSYVWSGVGAGSYSLTVKATDNGGAVTTSAAVSVTVTDLAPTQYTLDVATTGAGFGAVSLNPVGGTYNEGTVVTLTATADAGSVFTSWSGDLIGSVNPATVTMTANKAVVATFSTSVPYTEIIVDNLDAVLSGAWGERAWLNYGSYIGDNYLNILKTAGVVDTVTFTPSLPASGEWDVYHYNQTKSTCADNVKVVIVHADGTSEATINQKLEANRGWQFVGTYNFDSGTSGSVAISTEGIVSGYVHADAVKFVSAGVVPPPQYVLTVNDGGSGSGVVTLNPVGGTYDEGTVVTLTATADAGSVFVGWSGDLTSGVNTDSITMTANKVVIATFDLNVPAPEIIVDNVDAVLSGSWGERAWLNYGTYIGDDYLNILKTVGVVDTVTFTPNLPSAGDWAVYHYNQTKSTCADNVKVVIVHAGGTSEATINQKLEANRGWQFVGTYNFDAGTSGSVAISTEGIANAYVHADAVKFVSMGGGNVLPPSYATTEIDEGLAALATDANSDGDGDGMPDSWELVNGLNSLDFNDAADDLDGDGYSNLDEYICGTDPADPNAKLETGNLTLGGSGVGVTFDTVLHRLYGVEYKDRLNDITWRSLTNDIPGTGNPMTIIDSESVQHRFYRITVGLEK